MTLFSKMHFSQTKGFLIRNEITGAKLLPWMIQNVRLIWILLSVLWIMYINIRKFLVMACTHFPFHNHLLLCYSKSTFFILSSISLTIRKTRIYIYFSAKIIFHWKNSVSVLGDIFKIKISKPSVRFWNLLLFMNKPFSFFF